MDRRTLLRSALLVPAFGIPAMIRPHKAWAPPPPPPPGPTNGVQAVKFDGNTYLKNDGGYPLLPVSSPQFFGSFIYSSTQDYSGNSLNKNILSLQDDSGQQALAVRLITNKKKGWRIQFFAGGSANNWVEAYTLVNSLPFNGNYQRVKIYVDTSTSSLRATLNDALLTWNPITWRGSAFNIPLVTSPFNGGALRWYVGGAPFTEFRYVGNLAEVQAALDQTVDITNTNVKNAFTDPATGLPVRHAADGKVPVVDTNGVVVQEITSHLYLSGGQIPFPMNLPGWSAMSFDDFLAGTPGTPFHSMTDSNPSSSFYTAAGLLQTAAADPWGFTGES